MGIDHDSIGTAGQQLYHQYREEFLKIKNTQSEALKAARDAAAAAAASKQEEEAKSAWTQAEVALFIQAFNKVCRLKHPLHKLDLIVYSVHYFFPVPRRHG